MPTLAERLERLTGFIGRGSVAPCPRCSGSGRSPNPPDGIKWCWCGDCLGAGNIGKEQALADIQAVREAVEKMGRVLDGWENRESDPNRLAEALRLILARAKEPRVYALSEEERTLLKCCKSQAEANGWASGLVAAITAAISLEQPEEPRVTIEYRGRAKPKPFYSDEYMERVNREQAEPEEPFTVEEAQELLWKCSMGERVAAKLRTYIEKRTNDPKVHKA